MTDTFSGNGAGAGEIVERVGDRAERMLARFTEGLSADVVFGNAERVGDRVVITAAAVERGGGWGFGAGRGGDDEQGEGDGGGGGGGGRAEARPVAAIDIGPNGVDIRPIVDVTKVGIALIASLVTIWRLTRRGRRARS